MIRVQRPAAVPAVLQGRGKAALAALSAEYDADPAAFVSGPASREFNSDIYASDEVKTILRAVQHEKCCFCESKVTQISYGDVEHFRPKAAFRQRKGGPLLRPGYYWLAYEWTNLFLCCQLCNQRHKENLFPVRRARGRARSHHHPLMAEEPLFVNPEEDPSPHIRFREEYAYPFRNNLRGRTTIDALGLNRPELAERRREHLKIVKLLLENRKVLENAIQQAKAARRPPPAGCEAQVMKVDAQLTAMTADAAEYAGMIRAALA